jgi:hypothetical protein
MTGMIVTRHQRLLLLPLQQLSRLACSGSR